MLSLLTCRVWPVTHEVVAEAGAIAGPRGWSRDVTGLVELNYEGH